MGLNKQKGNMYPWVTHTWNAIKGKCPHDCSYCYMKRYPQPELHFDGRELKTDLGNGNFIFVGSSCDDWAEAIPDEWIDQILEHCRLYPNNRYLFQSKNPTRYSLWLGEFPPFTILGTTIESNFNLLGVNKAPIVYERYQAMRQIEMPKMVSIEPLMDCDIVEMMRWVSDIHPNFVSIGADSGNNHLPEPDKLKTALLIKALRDITTVKLKDNLRRLLKNKAP